MLFQRLVEDHDVSDIYESELLLNAGTDEVHSALGRSGALQRPKGISPTGIVHGAR